MLVHPWYASRKHKKEIIRSSAFKSEPMWIYPDNLSNQKIYLEFKIILVSKSAAQICFQRNVTFLFCTHKKNSIITNDAIFFLWTFFSQQQGMRRTFCRKEPDSSTNYLWGWVCKKCWGFFLVISFEIYFLKKIFNIGFIELCDFVIFLHHTKHRIYWSFLGMNFIVKMLEIFKLNCKSFILSYCFCLRYNGSV